MKQRGINYDTGTRYIGDALTRPTFELAEVSRDLRAIAGELHCNSVGFYGSDLERIVAAARLAQQQGLGVMMQLRAIDADRHELLAAVRSASQAAQSLCAQAPVILNIGCELSLFMRGLLPGRSFLTRMKSLALLRPLLPWINRRLNRVLSETLAEARHQFDGQIIYSAGVWEDIDWRPFDLAGVDLYRDKDNVRTYAADVRRWAALGKPLVITEFGCCAFQGAELRGGGGWLAVDHTAIPPRVKDGYVRDEAVQARTIGELLDIYVAEGVEGAYLFEFLSASNPHHEDARHDLDMAGYGIVRTSTDEPGRWHPKEAYRTLQEKYSRLALDSQARHP